MEERQKEDEQKRKERSQMLYQSGNGTIRSG